MKNLVDSMGGTYATHYTIKNNCSEGAQESTQLNLLEIRKFEDGNFMCGARLAKWLFNVRQGSGRLVAHRRTRKRRFVVLAQGALAVIGDLRAFNATNVGGDVVQVWPGVSEAQAIFSEIGKVCPEVLWEDFPGAGLKASMPNMRPKSSVDRVRLSLPGAMTVRAAWALRRLHRTVQTLVHSGEIRKAWLDRDRAFLRNLQTAMSMSDAVATSCSRVLVTHADLLLDPSRIEGLTPEFAHTLFNRFLNNWRGTKNGQAVLGYLWVLLPFHTAGPTFRVVLLRDGDRRDLDRAFHNRFVEAWFDFIGGDWARAINVQRKPENPMQKHMGFVIRGEDSWTAFRNRVAYLLAWSQLWRFRCESRTRSFGCSQAATVRPRLARRLPEPPRANALDFFARARVDGAAVSALFGQAECTSNMNLPIGGDRT